MVARNAVLDELQRLDPNCWLLVESNRQRIQDVVNTLSPQEGVETRTARNRYDMNAEGRDMLLGPNDTGETGLFRDGKKIDVVGIVKSELGIE